MNPKTLANKGAMVDDEMIVAEVVSEQFALARKTDMTRNIADTTTDVYFPSVRRDIFNSMLPS